MGHIFRGFVLTACLLLAKVCNPINPESPGIVPLTNWRPRCKVASYILFKEGLTFHLHDVASCLKVKVQIAKPHSLKKLTSKDLVMWLWNTGHVNTSRYRFIKACMQIYKLMHKFKIWIKSKYNKTSFFNYSVLVLLNAAFKLFTRSPFKELIQSKLHTYLYVLHKCFSKMVL